VNSDEKVLNRTIRRALSGEGAHVEAEKVFEGLDWRVAGAQPEKAEHSIYQVLNHVSYWQGWVVKWLKGKSPAIPKHASGSWPGARSPAGRKEWEEAVQRFEKGLVDLERLAGKVDLFSRNGEKTRIEMLHTIASHNSYHLGQVVVLRQMLGASPPPSGGLTW
jgi:uncharacterized damage-inducible protein DinB